jgi:hypothetical protein
VDGEYLNGLTPTTYIDKPGFTIPPDGEQTWRFYLQGYPRNTLIPSTADASVIEVEDTHANHNHNPERWIAA